MSILSKNTTIGGYKPLLNDTALQALITSMGISGETTDEGILALALQKSSNNVTVNANNITTLTNRMNLVSGKYVTSLPSYNSLASNTSLTNNFVYYGTAITGQNETFSVTLSFNKSNTVKSLIAVSMLNGFSYTGYWDSVGSLWVWNRHVTTPVACRDFTIPVPMDYLVITVHWLDLSGHDFETQLNIENTNYKGTNKIIGQNSSSTITYDGNTLIKYSGDNTSGGGSTYKVFAESYWINLAALQNSIKNSSNAITYEDIKIYIDGYWYSSDSSTKSKVIKVTARGYSSTSIPTFSYKTGHGYVVSGGTNLKETLNETILNRQLKYRNGDTKFLQLNIALNEGSSSNYRSISFMNYN